MNSLAECPASAQIPGSKVPILPAILTPLAAAWAPWAAAIPDSHKRYISDKCNNTNKSLPRQELSSAKSSHISQSSNPGNLLFDQRRKWLPGVLQHWQRLQCLPWRPLQQQPHLEYGLGLLQILPSNLATSVSRVWLRAASDVVVLLRGPKLGLIQMQRSNLATTAFKVEFGLLQIRCRGQI